MYNIMAVLQKKGRVLSTSERNNLAAAHLSA